MKTLVLIFFLFFSTSFIKANSNDNWVQVYNREHDVGFYMPGNPLIVDEDSLNSVFYSFEVDSGGVSIQTYIFDKAILDPNDILLNKIIQQENQDTLRAIAVLMLMATGAEADEVQEVVTKGIKGLEIGMSQESDDPNNQIISFVQFYFYNQKFVYFSISGREQDLTDLMTYKYNFFNSLFFNK